VAAHYNIVIADKKSRENARASNTMIASLVVAIAALSTIVGLKKR